MTDNAKTIINRAAYAVVGIALGGAISLGVWAYRDRVDADYRLDGRITGVDKDLQAYKLRIAETYPDKEDLAALRSAIDRLTDRMDKAEDRRR